jgi:hypothetical protein
MFNEVQSFCSTGTKSFHSPVLTKVISPFSIPSATMMSFEVNLPFMTSEFSSVQLKSEVVPNPFSIIRFPSSGVLPIDAHNPEKLETITRLVPRREI